MKPTVVYLVIGVDVIKFPKSQKGNQYTVVFMDYLTKWLEVWLEVFPTLNQTSLTILRLLVELSHNGSRLL